MDVVVFVVETICGAMHGRRVAHLEVAEYVLTTLSFASDRREEPDSPELPLISPRVALASAA